MPDYELEKVSYGIWLEDKFHSLFAYIRIHASYIVRILAFELLNSSMQMSMKHNTAVERCNK